MTDIADTDPREMVLGRQPLDGEESEEDNGKRLEKYKNDIRIDADLMEKQREDAKSDMHFINVPGGMWDSELTDSSSKKRVKIELDTVTDYVQRFVGERSTNPIGVEFKPEDGDTSSDDAELLNGIYRRDWRDNGGKLATDNAVLESSTCGYACLKMGTFFENPEDPKNNNMRVNFRVVNNAYDSVFFDGSAKLMTKMDARHVNHLEPYTGDGFEQAFPGFRPSSAYEPNNDFFTTFIGHEQERFLVSSRYELVKKPSTWFVYGNLATGEMVTFTKDDHERVEDELKRDDEMVFQREREVIQQIIEKTIFSGDAILVDTRRIAGKWLPFIPFYGYRTMVDHVEYYRGLVRKQKDPARVVNMQVSQLLENASSHGQKIPIVLKEQMENQDTVDSWTNKNNKAVLTIDPVYNEDTGELIATGPVGYLEPAVLDQNAAALLDIVMQHIQTNTGGVPQDQIDPNASGKAINALIKRANLATLTVSDNHATAVVWGGEVYQGIASEINNHPRMVKVLGKDGAEGTKELFKVIQDEETGMMIEANSLRGKRFKAYADVGVSYDTLREQTVEEIKGMLELLASVEGGQQYIPVLIAVMVENLTGVGLDPIKELNRRIMLLQGSVKPEGEDEEKMVAEAQQQQQEPGAQEKLLEAASQQQEAEARSLDASSVQKTADAGKKQAETIKIMSDIGIDRETLTLDRNKQFLDQQNAVVEQAQQGLG